MTIENITIDVYIEESERESIVVCFTKDGQFSEYESDKIDEFVNKYDKKYDYNGFAFGRTEWDCYFNFGQGKDYQQRSAIKRGMAKTLKNMFSDCEIEVTKESKTTI